MRRSVVTRNLLDDMPSKVIWTDDCSRGSVGSFRKEPGRRGLIPDNGFSSMKRAFAML